MITTRPCAPLLAVALTLSLFTVTVGCEEAIEIPNEAPTASVVALEVRDNIVDIYYELSDGDGDDLSITIQVCQGSNCLTPTTAPGGDGVRNLPTLPDEPVLHLYRWAAACEVEPGAYDPERVVRITTSDEEATSPPAESEPFTLTGLGVVWSAEDCSTE